MPLHDHSEAIHLLSFLRDNPPRKGRPIPYGHYAILLAIHEAGEVGIRTGQLGRRVDRNHHGTSTAMKPLVRGGLVNEQAATTGKLPSFYYTLTPLGLAHVEAMVAGQPVPTSESEPTGVSA